MNIPNPHPAAIPPATRWTTFALWTGFLTVGTLTQIAFKIASDKLDRLELGLEWLAEAVSTPAFGIAIACYLATFALWIVILSRTPLSRAFLLTALVYVTVTLGSALWLGERINLVQAAGIGLVIAGVGLLGVESRRPVQTHAPAPGKEKT